MKLSKRIQICSKRPENVFAADMYAEWERDAHNLEVELAELRGTMALLQKAESVTISVRAKGAEQHGDTEQ